MQRDQLTISTCCLAAASLCLAATASAASAVLLASLVSLALASAASLDAASASLALRSAFSAAVRSWRAVAAERREDVSSPALSSDSARCSRRAFSQRRPLNQVQANTDNVNTDISQSR